MNDLQQWSEDEVSIKRRTILLTRIQVTNKSHPQLASKRVTEIIKEKLSIKYERMQTPIDKKIKKSSEQVARNKIRLTTKVKKP